MIIFNSKNHVAIGLYIVALFLIAGLVGHEVVGDLVTTGNLVVGGTRTALSKGTAAPGTCTTGDVFFDTDATAGSNWFGCTATNTWTLMGGGGGGTGKYYQSWFGTRDFAGNRGFPFSTANQGADGFYDVSSQSSTASSVQGFNVSTTANEKAGVSFRLPFTPSAWTFYIHGNSRSTSQVTFSVTRSCSADGEAAATADNAVTGSTTPAATNRYYVVPITMVLTGCASGEVARVVVATTTTVNTDIIGLSTEVAP